MPQARSHGQQGRRRTCLTALAALLLAAAVFACTCVRAVELPFGHDESFSYLYHATQPVPAIIAYEIGLGPSNSHLINSLAMKVMALTLGTNEWELRLPNLIAHAMYLWASYLIARRLVRPPLELPAFALLVTNRFVLEYFGLARGYGLGLAFMMWGVLCAVRLVSGPARMRDAWLLGATMFGAVFSQFTFTLVALALLAALVIALSLSVVGSAGPRRDSIRHLVKTVGIPLGICYAALALAAAPLLAKLANAGEFYFGKNDGFWTSTVGSLAEVTLDQRDASAVTLGIAAVCTVLPLALWSVLGRWFATDRVRASVCRSALLISLVVVIGVGSTLQHYALGTPFLYQRTALFLLPLFSMVVIDLCGSASGKLRGRLGAIVLSAAAIASLTHLARTMTFSHSRICPWEAETRDMLRDLSADRLLHHPDRPIQLGIEWLFEPTINYYRVTRGWDWLEPVTREGMRAHAFDYYYHQTRLSRAQLPEAETEEVRRYPISRTVLVRRLD